MNFTYQGQIEVGLGLVFSCETELLLKPHFEKGIFTLSPGGQSPKVWVGWDWVGVISRSYEFRKFEKKFKIYFISHSC